MNGCTNVVTLSAMIFFIYYVIATYNRYSVCHIYYVIIIYSQFFVSSILKK